MRCDRSKITVLFVFASLVLAGCGGGGSGGGSSTVAAIQCVAPEPLVFPGASVTGARISGIIEIEANARVDKDTAEVELGQTTLTRVERLPSAVILGGYLSGVSGIYDDDSGAPTEFTYPIDSQDRFCIDLEPGQRVTVEFFGPEAGNRVRLLRASDGVAVSSVGFSHVASKQLTLPETAAEGTYVIDIQAQDQAGPFGYVLSSTPAGTGSAQNLDWAPGEFVPGEAVVTLSGSGDVSAQSVPFDARMRVERALGNNQHKVVMPAAMAQAQSVADQKRQTIDWVRELRKRPDVVSASPNYLFHSMVAFDAVNEPLYPDQWHYPLINLPQAWQLVPGGGTGVGVAVLDTGLFQYEGEWHEDLQANLPATCAPTTCADFVDDVLPPVDPGSALGGSVYHGTHVAGTIAASGTNGRGGAGAAPSARIFPVRVLDENGSGTLAEIVEAIDWSVDAGVEVINLSLGSPSSPDALQVAVDAAEAAGVLVVAAAGNSPNADLVYPAAYGNVFGVGAVDGAGVRAGYSNVGSSVDLVAPGGDASRDANQDGRSDVVVSTSGNASTGFTYAGLQGTSMATPHVAGVFALMKELDPSLNTTLVRALLENGELTSSPPAGEPGYGKGLIDAAKAVAAASTGNLALLSASPLLIEFSDGSGEEVLSLNRVGDPSQDIQNVSVTEGDSWLSASPAASDGDGFSVTLTLDRSQLEPGRAYRSDLTIDYQAGGEPRSLTVPVIVPVESAVAAREAGLHFVLMIDEFAQSVAQTVVSSVDGNYSFAFEVIGAAEQPSRTNQIVAGESYYLVAGTDLNNDGFICAAGEACAEYPIAGLREKVEVVLNGDTASLIDEEGQPIAPEDLVMTTSFSRPLSAQSLPRPGFEGYKLLESAHEYAPRAVAE